MYNIITFTSDIFPHTVYVYLYLKYIFPILLTYLTIFKVEFLHLFLPCGVEIEKAEHKSSKLKKLYTILGILVMVETTQYQSNLCFLAVSLVPLCVNTYFIGSPQSKAGAYSITKASEHSPTSTLDNAHTKQLNCLNTGV